MGDVAVIGVRSKDQPGKLMSVPIEQIARDPGQPRKIFDPDRLRSLADSISTHGLLQPLVLRRGPVLNDQGVEVPWMIVAGERRWRAAQLASLPTVPAMERTTDNPGLDAVASLIENVQREDLNVIEIAMHLRLLRQEHGYAQREMAAVMGRGEAYVSKVLGLLDLPQQVQERIMKGDLTQRHGEALKALPDSIAIKLGHAAADEQWSVKELERRVRQHKEPRSKPVPPVAATDPNLKHLESALTNHFGSSVRIHWDKSRGSGKLEIDYASIDVLAGLLDKFGYQAES